MKLEDLVALAKAGYSPKQVKELLEMVETSPSVAAAPVEQVVAPVKTESTPVDPAPKAEEGEDPIETLKNLLN